MPTEDWERGFAAGWKAGRGSPSATVKHIKKETSSPEVKKKKPRKASAYSKRYGKAFKKLASKYKKKNGQWKKDGFKRCGAAARKEAKR